MDEDYSGDCTLSNSVAALYCYMVEYTLEEQIFAWITILIWERLKYDVSHCLFSRCYHSAIDKYKKQNDEIQKNEIVKILFVTFMSMYIT